MGGANFGIGYHSKAGDPTDSVHWVQVIHTNDPLGRAKDFAVNEGNGFFDYIDDIPDAGKPANPYYDVATEGAAANSTDFEDRPVARLENWRRLASPGLSRHRK